MPAKTLRLLFAELFPWESSKISCWWSDAPTSICMKFLDGLSGTFSYYGENDWRLKLSDGVVVRRYPK